MSSVLEYKPGGYSFIKGVFQYSAGVASLPGFRIERVRFRSHISLTEGFKRIAELIAGRGRPLNALCGCELRSPAPFTEEGFKDFNRIYVGTLSNWAILADGLNPVARSNVCPAIDAPREPGFHAFSFTTPNTDPSTSFVISGSAEAPEAQPNYRDHIVSRGDLSTPGLRRKAVWVLDEMERRLAAFGVLWTDTTAVQLYTVHNIYPFLADEIVRRGAARNGLTWHFDRPPVLDLEYEMDCRHVRAEWILSS